jgi:hypothetical protein
MAHGLETHTHHFPEVFFPGQQQKERLGPWLRKLALFMRDTLAPKLNAIGLTNDQVGQLWMKWMAPLGSIYKETKVDDAAFMETLNTFVSDIVIHLQRLKYFMHTTDWQQVVDRIEGASDTELTFLMKSGASHFVTIDSGRPVADPADEVRTTVYDVYLPNAETPGEAQIRISFPAKGVEMQDEPIQVTENVMHDTHNRIGHLLVAKAA